VPGSAPQTAGQKIAVQVLIGVAIFATVVLICTAAYCTQGWGFSDALYMVVITVFGVGYGEIQPVNTTLLRVITMLTILAGPFATVYIVGALLKIITEKGIQTAMAENRKLKSIDEIKRHTIICGFGRIGQIIARELEKAGQAFLIIDRDPDRIALSESLGYLTLEGDAGDEEVLGRAHIETARTLTAVLPNDMVNVFITLTARNMNASLSIIARAENPTTEKKLRQAGANEIILPALAGGLQIAHRITRPSLLGVLDADSSVIRNDLQELGVDLEETLVEKTSPIAGQPLSAFIDGLKGRCIVLAIRRPDGTDSQHPAPHTPLHAGDRIISLMRKSA
jgi:voltage-gated potassium channel